MKPIKHFSSICIIALLVTGCSTQQASLQENISTAQQKQIAECKNNTPSSKKIKKEAVALSCVASLVFSKLIGKSNPKALICVAGGAAGFLIGSSVAERKCEYSVRDNQLEGELAHASGMQKNFVTYLSDLQNKLDKQSSQVRALSTLARQGKSDQSSVLYVQNKVLQNLRKQRAMLNALSQERMVKVETIGMAQSRHKDIEKIRKLQLEVNSLLFNIKKMQQNSIALSKLNEVTRDLYVKASK